MPIVPKYDNFQAAPSSLPQARVTSPDMPDIAGQQAQQFGQGAMQAGQAAAQVANDIAAQANQLRIDDALNQAKEAALRLTYDKDKGFTSLKGVNALQRPDGKPLADEYGGALKDQISQIASTLGNDVQRQAFALHSNDILSALRSQATQHEAGEFRNYALSTSEGIQITALRDIGLNWQNPDAVNSAVERIRAETYRQAQLLGKSAEWQEAQARKLTSNGHKVALLAALENNNPEYADSYLGKYSGQMDADDILAVRGHITREMDNRVGMSAAGEVMRGMLPRMQTSDAERAFNIAVGTESGGRQFGKDGKPLTSSAGAIGIAQVMPGTAPEAAKLAGLPWDENRYKTDLKYNLALGRAYFQKQLQDNGGDIAKAYAAYNAGAGRLKEALKKEHDSRVREPAVSVNDQNYWLMFMPPETRAYVEKNMREYEAGRGKLPSPTFAEVDNALRADPRLANSPARYKAAREEASRQFEEQTKAIKQREDDAIVQAQSALVANGGQFQALPHSIRSAIPPGKYDEMLTYAGKIASGQPVTTDWNTYTQLRSMAVNDPTKFGVTDLRLYYPNLAPAQREQLVDLQMKAKDPKQQPDVVSLAQQLETAHRLLGFKDSDLEKKGRFDDAAAQSIAAEVRNKKRDLTFEERDQIIKRLMLPTTGGGWFGTQRLYEVSGTSKEGVAKPKISDDHRKLIISALKSEGIQPSDDNITARFNLKFGLR